ncbi:MAG TPA: FHA domain-containing protein [Thermoanaerobaculia bacterium]|nr:FHA domain-containing protein [Thermoanaerobaculia bacterium]
MTPRLNAVSGELAGRSFALDAEALTVGRDRANALHLRDLAVSRHHCVIEGKGRLLLRDLGSRLGTFVNGIPIAERLLEHGDLVTVGGSLFLVQTREEEQGEESPSVVLDDRPWVAESTVHLAPDTAFLLRPEASLTARPPDARAARDLQALLRIGNALHEIRATAPLARRLLELALETVPAERAALLLLDPTGALPASFALDRRGPVEPFAVSRTLVERVVAERSALLSNDVLQTGGWDGAESI